MRIIFVSYEETQRYYKSRKIRSRLPGGRRYQEIQTNFRRLWKHPCVSNLKEAMRAAAIYCLGSRMIEMFGRPAEKDHMDGLFMPEENQILYHLAPSRQLDSIRRNGLAPSKEFEYVYLTDDADYIMDMGYLYWKVNQAKNDTEFVILEVDVYHLAQKYEIYQLREAHEFAVKRVPVECLDL